LCVGLEADLHHAIAQVAGERSERLGDKGRALAIIGIHVGVAVSKLLEEEVGPGMIREPAVVVEVDARQIEFREEFIELRALGRGFLKRGNGNLVVAGPVGAKPLLERCLRGSDPSGNAYINCAVCRQRVEDGYRSRRVSSM